MKKLFILLIMMLVVASSVFAADQTLDQKTAMTTPTDDDIIYMVDDPDGTPLSRKITRANFFNADVDMLGSASVADDFSLGTSYQFVASGTDTEIQAAIDAAEAAGGGIVHLGEGTFNTTSDLSIDGSAPIILQGSGEGTIININGSGINGVVVGNESSDTDGVFIRDIAFVGKDTDNGDAFDTGSAIKLINHFYGVIENVNILNGGDGILITSTGAGRESFNNVLDRVIVRSTEGYGLRCETQNGGTDNFTNSTKVSNSRFINNGTQLELVRGTTTGANEHHVFSNCYFEVTTSGKDILLMTNSDRNSFRNCTFDGLSNEFMVLIDSDSTNNQFNLTVLDCKVDDNSDSSIALIEDEIYMGNLTTDGVHAIRANDSITVVTTDAEIADFESSNALAHITINATNAGDGDAYIKFQNAGSSRWSAGFDDSDSDKFKISSGANLPTETRLTIDTSGNVGIGTSSPGNVLDVEGTTNDGTNHTNIAQSGTGRALYVERNVSGATRNVMTVLQDNASNNQNCMEIIQDGTGDVLVLKDGATEVFSVVDGGHVAIGDTAPDSELDIDDGGGASGSPDITFNDSRAAVGFDGSNNVTHISAASSKHIAFRTNGIFNANEQMRLTSGGDLGIGDTTPDAKLDVEGDAIVTSDLTVEGQIYTTAMNITSADGLAINADTEISGEMTVTGAMGGLSRSLSVSGNSTISDRYLSGGSIKVSGTSTQTIGAMSVGETVSFQAIGAVTVTIDINGSQKFYLPGVGFLDLGDTLDSDGTDGAIVVLECVEANEIIAVSDGKWSDGGAT